MSERSQTICVAKLNFATSSSVASYSLDDLSYHLTQNDGLQGAGRKLLLQGVEVSLCPQIIDIAWQLGWTVAILREDFRRYHHADFFNALGPCLLVSSQISSSGYVSLNSKKQATSSVPAYKWREDECAAILFTSGSTGTPKGVCHSRGNMIRSAELFIRHFNLTKKDHLYCIAPVHTASGFRCLLISRLSGVMVTMHQSQGDSFLSIIKEIAKAKPTKIICGPAFVHQLAAYGSRLVEYLPSVDTLLCTGAVLLKQDREAVENTLQIKVLNYYGQTESAGIELADNPNSSGQVNFPAPCDGVEIVLKPDKKVQGVFQLHIKAETIYLGYLGEPLFRRTTLNTGDLVTPAPDGGLNFIGRGANVFKAPSTEWLFPELLEIWLKKQPFVKDTLVNGVPVPGGFGCEVWIDTLQSFKLRETKAAIIKHLGPEYKPVAWYDCKITRTALGKIDQVHQKQQTHRHND